MSQDDKIRCTMCGAYLTIEDFYEKDELVPIGLMFYDNNPEYNAYYFNHNTRDCGTTLAISVNRFKEYLDEPVPDTNYAGTPECSMRCARIEDLELCDNDCVNAPYRRLLLRMKIRGRSLLNTQQELIFSELKLEESSAERNLKG